MGQGKGSEALGVERPPEPLLWKPGTAPPGNGTEHPGQPQTSFPPEAFPQPSRPPGCGETARWTARPSGTSRVPQPAPRRGICSLVRPT